MGRRRRRRHSAEFKAAVIAECMRPGVSIAAVALAHSLNANMLRKWVIDAEQAGARAPRVLEPALVDEPQMPAPTFIPLALTAPRAPNPKARSAAFGDRASGNGG